MIFTGNSSSLRNIVKQKLGGTASGSFDSEVSAILDDIFIHGRTATGSIIQPPPVEAAEKFMGVLRKTISASSGSDYASGELGSTAVSSLSKLDHSSPWKLKDGEYCVTVYHDDDMYRPSLAPSKYNGVDDIANVLNNGYSARKAVWGRWVGHSNGKIRSLKKRKGAHFVERAIDDYMGNYSSKYGVKRIEVIDRDNYRD